MQNGKNVCVRLPRVSISYIKSCLCPARALTCAAYVTPVECINRMVIRILLNTLRPRQDGRHFADDIFTYNFLNENCCILISFSLKYVHKGPIDKNPALVQIMAWRRSGDKPLCEPMMISLPTHICVTRPQWVNHIAIPTWVFQLY